MADIILKNRNNEPTTYSVAGKIKIPKSGGGYTEFPQPTGNINITNTNQTDVTDYATAQVVDANLVAGNIKKDVTILGITGTHEGGGGGIPGGYNITLVVDGTPWQVVSVAAGGKLDFPTVPTKSGYSFGGWSTTSGAGAPDVVFPYTPAGDTTLYAVWTTWQCTVANLGSSSPSSVTFTHVGTFPTFAQKTDSHGNIFLEVPTMYRKVNTVVDSQITSFTIAMTNVDGTYSPYSCFVKEDGVSVMPYVWIGKYRSSAASGSINSTTATPVTQTIGNGRTGARALGAGYQLWDWQIWKLWQDLLICKMNTVNTNSGSGIGEDALGFQWNKSGVWADGVSANNTTWYVCNAPSKYADSATSSTAGYYQLGYSGSGTSGNEISKLGYDSSHPFVSLPAASVSNSSYNTYYCDGYYYSSGSHPVYCDVGFAHATDGAFLCNASLSWASSYGVRLCFRPLSE